MIANHSENFKNLINERYATEEEFRNAWKNGNRQNIVNEFEENGVDFNRFREQIGNDVDVFDIIEMIGFDKDARLKSERVGYVKDSSIYTQLNNEQKQIADELLAIFIQNDCIAIEIKNYIENSKKGNASNNVDYSQLQKLKELLDGGVISQEEFDAKKKQILGL